MHIPEHMQPLDAFFERKIVDIENIYAGIKFRVVKLSIKPFAGPPFTDMPR